MTPEFIAACERYLSLNEAEQAGPTGHRAFAMVLKHAPPEFMDQLTAGAKELGLMPRPTGVDANGSPVYRLDDLLKQTNSTEDDFQRFLEETGIQFDPASGPGQRVH